MRLSTWVRTILLALGGVVAGQYVAPFIGAIPLLNIIPVVASSIFLAVGTTTSFGLFDKDKNSSRGKLATTFAGMSVFFLPASLTIPLGMSVIGAAAGLGASYGLGQINYKVVYKNLRDRLADKIHETRWKLGQKFPFLKIRPEYIVASKPKQRKAGDFPRTQPVQYTDPLFKGHGLQSNINVAEDWQKTKDPRWRRLDAEGRVAILPPRRAYANQPH